MYGHPGMNPVISESTRDFSSFSIEQLMDFLYASVKPLKGSIALISNENDGWEVRIRYNKTPGINIMITKTGGSIRKIITEVMHELLALK